MQEAIDLRYTGKDVEAFFNEIEKLYDDAGFTGRARYGMVMKSINTDQKMMQFVLVRGDDTFKKFKKLCLSYERNQKVLDLDSSYRDTQGGKVRVSPHWNTYVRR